MRYSRSSSPIVNLASGEQKGKVGWYRVHSEKQSEDFPRGFPYGEVTYRYHYPTYDINNHSNREEPTKPVLFNEYPAKLQITTAFTHPAVRHAIPTVMARIHLDHPGLQITADSDLSTHSAQLAKHAQELGLPVVGHPDNPDFKVTNDLTFIRSEDLALPTTDIVPQHEVTEARQFIRNALRPSKPHMSPQFDQPQLPGLEDY